MSGLEPGRLPWTELVLMRHGETEWNRSGRMQGTLDSRLTKQGLAQAEALAEVLADEPIASIYASDLGRTQATAAPIARRLAREVHLHPGLRERHYGELQGLTWAEVETRFPQAYRRFNARDPHYRPPGGESMIEFRERVLAAIHEIVDRHAGSRVAVVSHGGAVGAIYRFVREMPLDAKRDYPLWNASINRFRVVDGRWQITVWGDTSHLPDTRDDS